MKYDVLDYILCAFDMCLLIILMQRMYGKVVKNNYIFYGVSVLLVLGTTYVLQSSGNYTHTLTSTISSFFLLGFFPENRQKKKLFSTILFAISGFWNLGFNHCIILLPDLSFTMVKILYHLVFGVILVLALSIHKSKTPNIPNRLWGLLYAIPLASGVAYICLVIMMMGSAYSGIQRSILLLPILLAFLFINLMVFYLYDQFSALIVATTENALLEQQMEIQDSHYKELEAAHLRIRSIRHDMKNNLQAVSSLLKEGQTEELAEYLDSMNDHINISEKVISTQNKVLDSILNIKIMDMESNNIKVVCEITVPPELKLNFSQTVTLFGNLLDNAKEACLKLPKQKRTVTLKISYISGMLFISLQNPVHFRPAKVDGEFLSMKGDEILHGIGLKNVQNAVDEFNGKMDLRCDDENFHAKVILYNV